MQRGLDILEKKYGPEHGAVADALLAQASLYTQWKKYDRAEPLYQRAWAIGEKVFPENRRKLAEILMDHAVMLRQAGQPETGERARSPGKGR